MKAILIIGILLFIALIIFAIWKLYKPTITFDGDTDGNYIPDVIDDTIEDIKEVTNNIKDRVDDVKGKLTRNN